jgi:hypothetical protein
MMTMMKLLSKFLKFLKPEPERSESEEDYMARMRAPYLANLEQRFGKEFVTTVRSVCTWAVTVDGKLQFCGKPGTHEGVIGKLCDEHHAWLNRIPPSKVLG